MNKMAVMAAFGKLNFRLRKRVAGCREDRNNRDEGMMIKQEEKPFGANAWMGTIARCKVRRVYDGPSNSA